MASSWQETYEKLKKRKELVDTLSGGGDLAPIKSTKSTVSNRNLYTSGAEAKLQSNIAPIKTSSKTFPTTTKISTKKDDSKITTDLSLLSKTELLDMRKSLQDQLTNYDRKEKREWWDKDDNILENVGNVFYKLFAEDQKNKYADDEKYNALKKQYDDVWKALEDKTVEEESKDLDTLDKVWYTMGGGLTAGVEGINTSVDKVTSTILGRKPQEVRNLSPEERLATIAREQTDGIAGVGLDLIGGISRQIPNLLIPGGAASSTLAFANFGGGAYEEAKRMGVSEEKATAYGVTIGGLELLLNKLLPSYNINGQNVFGKTATGNLLNNLMGKISSNALLRNTLTGATGEFTEEYLQEFLDPIIRESLLEEDNNVGILNGKDAGEIAKNLASYTAKNFFSKENAYAGLLGGLTSVAMGLPSNINAQQYESATGRNIETGYTQNEQTVIDSLVNEKSSEIAKQKAIETEIKKAISTKETEQGGNLSTKEKTALTEAIKTKIEAGEIDVSSSKLSNKEISALREIVEEQMQQGQLDTNKIESILGNTITEQDGLLAKSYQETAKRSQNFTYDNTKITNEQEKAVYESAAKYFNDTTRSHEFVEKVAKISKDKGTNYGFINNEELQSLGHDVEGKQVNGLVRTNQDGKQTVLINIDSPKALNTIVGHETTHLLEGTTEFKELQEAIFNYAKEKGDFDARQKALNELYEGIENANIDSELTADLVGDYLFTDSEFIDSLSIQKPTVFQRLRELIDDLVVRFTGTKEEQQLREVQKKFKEAYRKNAQSIEGTQYSFAGVKGAKNSQNVLSRLDAAQKLEQEGNTNEEIRQKTGWFKGTDGQWRIEISDRDSQIAQQVKSNETYKLSEVLKHDKLYEAYPELKDYKIKFKDMKSNGGFNQLTSTISINNKFTNDLASLRGTLMHEVQHAIQKREGFARGTYYDAKNAENYRNSAGEQEARDVKSRLNYSKEQIKDIAPAMSKPDSNRLHEVGLFSKKVEADQNIKYSLSETGTHGDLMAIHNLNEEKLRGILELGGFPFPSIAITKPANISHEGYGNISVLFDKTTIDPKVNNKNKVYSRDAYTPRFPRVGYKTDSNVIKNIKNVIGDYDYRNPNTYLSDATNLIDNVEDSINNRGLEETVNKIKKDSSMKYVYLKSINPSFKELTKAEQYSTKYTNETLQKFIDNYDGEYPLNDIPSGEIDNYVPQMVEAYEEQLRKEYSKVTEFDANTINEIVESQTKQLKEWFSEKDKFLTAASRLQKHGVDNQVIDTKATDELIDNTINQEEYNKWVDELFDGIIAKKGLRNNKDYFTPSGNPRSFEQLHDEYNLDNVVKIMTALDDTGSESSIMTGINEIAGNVSKRLTSIQDIKNNEYMIQSYTDEEYSAILEEYGDKLFNLQQNILDRGHNNSSNQFIAMDNLGTAIAEVARDYGDGKRVNANTITTALNEYGFNPTIEESQTILDMFDEFKELPTEYFEAKPKRAVRLNEVQAIVIPSDTNAEFKQQLQDAGLRYYEYDRSIEGDRQRVINQFDDLKFSLSQQGEQTTPTGDYNVYGEDVKLEQTIAPLQEEIKTLTETVQELKEQLAPVNEQITEQVKEVEYTQPTKAELDNLMALQEKGGTEYANTFFGLRDKYGQRKLYKGINEYKKAPDTYEAPIKGDEFAPTPQNIVEQQGQEAFNNIDESSMPMETEDIAPDLDYEMTSSKSLFETRNYEDVGSKKVNAYQYDNPEVKPFFQEEAQAMLGDLKGSIKGERSYNDQLYYESGGEQGFYGTERQTTDDIAELLDGMDGKYKYTYADIEKGLNAIIKDEGSENNAISKRIEFYLDQRLREGYTTVEGIEVPANQEYIKMMAIKDMDNYYDSLIRTDEDAPIEYVEKPVENVSNSKDIAPIRKLEKSAARLTKASTPESISKAYQLTIDGKAEKVIDRTPYKDIAEVLVNEPKTESDRNKRKWAIFKANVFDKGIVFEDIALKENNRELIAKWDYTLTSEARGQYAIGNGHNGLSKSLNDIRTEVENTGNTKDFYNYMYHKHNVDRMTLDKRFGVENKPVFGESVTAEQSQAIVNQYEKTHPEFIEFAQDVYDYNNADKQLLVDSGVISQEIADLWGKMYPHYVPTRRTTDTGIDINVPLDTRKTGINAPIKKATGGSSDILPLFDTMAMRTLQTYRATAKNSFGVELMNTLGVKTESNQTNVDEVIDNIDTQDGLLQEGKKGKNPTFTVFEDGEKKTFEITKDMYDALKPVSESSLLSKTIKPLNVAGNIRRGLLTEYNPTFMLTNAIKDTQDILINSQHVARTYAKIPEAHKQLMTKGYWYKEYIANGGEQNSYFDNETNTFKTENKGLAKIMDLPPLSTISKINNHIEMIPRLAEYIASREAGRSIEVSMLDAARVTTNFKAGGAVTKWANRNGATFLNASVQGAMQQVRNVREAKANGVRGWVNLATKFAIAGLPAILLNNLVWDDDDEYEELSDYVKQNYYVIGKTDDGTFIRIPKGRAVAVIQDAINQMENLITGDDEVDLKSFIDLTINNLAPNNPLENNIFSPITQVATNKAWYGGDLLPTRLKNLPAAEQYDESTDMLSRWIGETFNVSPYKVNYLLDQYSGGIGDLLLPMMTPEAESDGDSLLDYAIAPLRSKFTTNSTFNNQNVSDFYDLKEKLTVQANKSNASDEDALKNKYMNSVNAELSDLYEQKREIQNSDLSNSEKYKQAKEIQEQINEITKNALSEYTNVSTNTNYSTVGDREYYKKINSEGEVEWTKVNDEEAENLDNLSMSSKEKNTYFKTKSEISSILADYKDDKTGLGDLDEDSDEYKEAIEELSDDKKADIIDKVKNSGLNDEQKAYLYGKYYSSDKTLEKVTSSGISFDDFLTFSKDSLSLEDTEAKAEYLYNADISDEAKTVIYETSVLSGFDNEDKYKDYKVSKAAGIDINSWLSYKKQEFKADKDNQGNSISGSRKEKIISYINGLDLSIPQKAILIRQEYSTFREYNNAIVEYVDGLDISYEEMVSILEELDMTVHDDGTVTWK